MLPRLLAPVLPGLYSLSFLASRKVQAKPEHSDSPCHAFAHCKVSAPAAPRRAWGIVSVPISGLLLSQPVLVVGLVGRYPANCLMSYGAIVRRLASFSGLAFQHGPHTRHYPQFPEVIPVLAAHSPYVTELFASPLRGMTCMA